MLGGMRKSVRAEFGEFCGLLVQQAQLAAGASTVRSGLRADPVPKRASADQIAPAYSCLAKK